MFTLFAGPCQIETLEHALRTAERLKGIAQRLDIQFVYKSSFDKANRTSMTGKRGPGIDEGLNILRIVRNELGVKVMTDIHESYQARFAAERGVDVLQIPAMLSRQTDLLIAAAETGKDINIKKGQGMSAQGAIEAARKVRFVSDAKVYLCERGTTFGYNDLVVDFRSLAIMREHFPVMFDATHSIQQPGSRGTSSGGQRQFIEPLARAACAVGIDALFIETHEDPDNAPSDGPCMLPLDEMEALLHSLKAVSQTGRGSQ